MKLFYNRAKIISFLCFLGFMLCADISPGQNPAFEFVIVDASTKKPVPFTYVLIKGKNISEISSEKGIIKIKAMTSDTLVIYQVGYFIKKIIAGDLAEKNNIVELMVKNVELDEVTVNYKRVDTFEKANSVSFLDFEFLDDYILALVDVGKKYNALILYDVKGNKIARKNLPIQSTQLFKDCFDNIHLLTKDSVYQVYYNYTSIFLLKPFAIAAYHNFLAPCECVFGDKYIFKTYMYRKLKSNYILYDAKNNTNGIIACVADSQAIQGFNTDFDINYFLSKRRRGFGYLTSVTEINKNIDKLREELFLSESYTNLLRPVESEMKKIDTSFVLFDYTNKTRYTFTLGGKLVDRISFKTADAFLPRIFIDPDNRHLIFPAQNRNGVTVLYRYDFLKNTITHKFEVPDFYFINNYKVKGNVIYFIYKDRSTSATKTKIVYAAINWQPL